MKNGRHIFDTQKSFVHNAVLDACVKTKMESNEIIIYPAILDKYSNYVVSYYNAINLTKEIEIKVQNQIVLEMFNNPPVWFATTRSEKDEANKLN